MEMREIGVPSCRANEGDRLLVCDRLRFGIARTADVQPPIEGVARTFGVSLFRHDLGDMRPAENTAAGNRAYLLHGYVNGVAFQHRACFRQPLHANVPDPAECLYQLRRVRIDEVTEDVCFRSRYRGQLNRRDHLYADLPPCRHRLVHTGYIAQSPETFA